ncbi:CLUMA_CG010823, isoform A [Clunio marinus]|uniref:CLUMA_CG010823, isoform A n=1 Tax=Clunio marinus TaxID=568069 RepID=A0A1J1ICF2_9DIPT|nr:CLUMA_CG010823, isoform A [Clunio marinus]
MKKSESFFSTPFLKQLVKENLGRQEEVLRFFLLFIHINILWLTSNIQHNNLSHYDKEVKNNAAAFGVRRKPKYKSDTELEESQENERMDVATC